MLMIVGIGAYLILRQQDETNANNTNAVINVATNADALANNNSAGQIANSANDNSSTTNTNDAASNFNDNGNSNEVLVNATEWALYENTAKGYSMSYPQAWVQFQRMGDDVVFASEQGRFPEVAVETLSKDATTFDLQLSSVRGYVLSEKTETTVSIEGYRGTRVSGMSPTVTTSSSMNPWRLDIVLIDGVDYVYKISGREASEYFDEMISSIKLK